MNPGARSLAAALLAAALLGGVAPAPARAAETVTVVVKKTALRRDRQFFAPAVGEASFGDRLTLLERDRDWLRVSAGSAAGWVHASAVTTRSFTASAAGAPAAAADERDVALAGKGFNPQVEQEYRRKNPGANFAAVDRMEKVTVSEEAIAEFLREGRLEPRGGGR